MNFSDIADSLKRLKIQNADQIADRSRIRAILDGGPAGIAAILAWNVGKQASMDMAIDDMLEQYGTDLPTVNMMDSGMTRLAQKVGRIPTLKPPKSQGETVVESHQRRIDLLRTWDYQSKAKMVYPQVGRWTPGYGFAFAKLTQRRDMDGRLYPVAEPRDPYDVYPGWLGPDQQPNEYATVRRIPITELVHYFDDPAEAAMVTRRLKERANSQSQFSFVSNGPRTWEGVQSGVEIIEYENLDGKYVVLPEAEHILSFVKNPINYRTWSFGKRYSFNKLIGQYHHVIGLQAMQTKLNILYLMAIEDGVMVPTDIDGEVEGTYEFGRDIVNQLAPGTKVQRNYPPTQTQTLQAINTLERQLRIGANYDVQQDGQSPNSFATGMGMRELQGAVTDNVREYHLVLGQWSEDNDEMRFRFAEELYKGEQRSYFDMRGKKRSADITTTINGDYRTRRIYGAMATFDDHQKIIVGMQLETGGYIDKLTFQENIDGLDDLELINERITRAEYRGVLLGMLAEQGQQDPNIKALMVEIMKDPDKEQAILEKVFAPPPPPEQDPAAMMGEQAQMMAAQQGGPVGVPPPPIQTVLSRVEGSGAVDGGVQSVAVR